MQTKTQQFLFRYKYTQSNRLPQRYSRKFLFNTLKDNAVFLESNFSHASMALLRWRSNKSFFQENRVSYSATCFLTSRPRGISKRFSISRVRLKQISNEGKLFGLRKSSW